MDTIEDRLDAVYAAQSYPAVILVVVAAILLNWLLNRLLHEPEIPAAPAPVRAPEPTPTPSDCEAPANAL